MVAVNTKATRIQRTGRRAVPVVAACMLMYCLSRSCNFVPAPRNTSPETPRNGKVAVASGGLRQLDASYNQRWLEVEEHGFTDLTWLHPQTGWATVATGLYAFDMVRFFGLVKPTSTEALIAILIYLGLYTSRFEEINKMDKHYQVSFYASCGWTFYALASLIHALSYGPDPLLDRGSADSLHTAGAWVFLASCGYFYSYHWGRMARHVQEGRFRPYFALGLASLTFVHGLTVGHIWKMMEDPGWYDTVQKIYPDQWQWIADTRLAELYLTALALFLVILHLRGVLTGTANATWVFLGTVIVPTAALFLETFQLRAVAWQHYWMVGPKHFFDS